MPCLLASYRRAPGLWAVFVLVGATVLAYRWTLGAYFAADDFGLVARFIDYTWAEWRALFFADWSAGLWAANGNELRPVSALTFMIDARLWGIDPMGYHLTNLILHLVCSITVLLIGVRVFRGDWTMALAAALLFALHPTPSRAVAWISGRVDLLSAVGFLLAFYAFLRFRDLAAPRWLVVAWAAYAFGIFSKESCLLMPLVAAGWDVFRTSRTMAFRTLAAPYAGWAALVAIYVYCRSFGVEGIVPDRIALDRVDDVAATFIERVGHYAAAMLLAPQLSAEVTAWLAVRPLLVIPGIVAGAALTIWMARRGMWRRGQTREWLFYGLVWPAITVAPLVVTYMSARHLYTATAGFVLMAIAALAQGHRTRVRLVASVAVAIAIATVQLTVERSSIEAALDRSRQIHESVVAAADRAKPGDVLLLDVPAREHGMWVWAWASPFALQPPFTDDDLTQRMIVVEPPGVYKRPTAWPRASTAERLRDATGRGWLITEGGAGSLEVRPLSADDLAPLLEEPADINPHSFEALLEDLAAAPGPQGD